MENNGAVKLYENTIVLSLKLGRPGNKKKASLEEVETASDKTMLHLSKDLLDSQEYQNVVSFDMKIRNYIKLRAFPSFFREGLYLVPVKILTDLETKLKDLRTEREKLISAFFFAYPQRIKEAEERLKDQFSSLDYPDEERMRKHYTWETRYLTLEAPKRLESISVSLYQEEAEKVKKFWQETAIEVKDALRVGFSELLSHMVDKLGYNGDKPKVFKESSVNRLTEFFEVFNNKNVMDDEELSLLVQKAKNVLNGVDVKALRKDLPFRDSIQKDLEPIKQNLDSMLIDRPSRAISFEDD